MKKYYSWFSILVTLTILPLLTHAQERLPDRPTGNHPSSAQYGFDFSYEKLTINGRSVEIYRPAINRVAIDKPVTTFVYGHGQAIDLSGYNMTFEHLAKKGYAVIFPQFDTGFFDQDWSRMGNDFNTLTNEALKKYPNSFDRQKLIYSGHSKGGYVSLMAAGLSTNAAVKPASIIVFAPADSNAQVFAQIPQQIPATIVYSDSDTVIDSGKINSSYQQLPNLKKQLLTATSYVGTSPEIKAIHMFVLNKSVPFFGGPKGVNELHFFATWKWLIGTAQDLDDGGNVNSTFVYGSEALETGLARIKHQVKRSW